MKVELTYREIRAALPSTPLAIIQRLGHDARTGRALVCDGIEGEATRRAVYLNPAVVNAGVALYALRELLKGAEEELGRNDGPDVHKYARKRGAYVRGKNLFAWCALFASWCVWQVYQSFERVSGAVRLVRDHLTQVQVHELRPGDLVAWWSASRGRPYGHVGVVVAITRQHVWTIEGNVDIRRGVDGVAARRLPLPHLTRADGSLLAACGRYIPKVTPKPPIMLAPEHVELDEDGDECSQDDDHCA